MRPGLRDAVPPALAIEHAGRAPLRQHAVRMLQPACQEFGAACSALRADVPASDAAGLAFFHQVAAPVVRVVPGRSIGEENAVVGFERERIHTVQRHIAETIEHRDLGQACRSFAVGRKQNNPLSGQRHGQQIRGPYGQCGDVRIEALHLDHATGFEHVQHRAGARKQSAAVSGKVIDVGQRRDHLGIVERPIGLERAVHDRHGDGSVAAAQHAIAELTNGVEHQAALQRRSYWLKLGSAPGSV